MERSFGGSEAAAAAGGIIGTGLARGEGGPCGVVGGVGVGVARGVGDAGGCSDDFLVEDRRERLLRAGIKH